MKLFINIALRLLLVVIFLFSIFQLTKPYFFSKISSNSQLGFNTIIIENRNPTFETSKITKGNIIKNSFTASENNLGIILVKFNTFGKINKDVVRFRIKESSSKGWYYQRDYKVDQFQNNTYFTFGFDPILDSKQKTYLIEIESIKGKKNDSVAISSNFPQFATAYRMAITDINSAVKVIKYKFLYTVFNIPGRDVAFLIIFLMIVIILMTIDKKYFQIKSKNTLKSKFIKRSWRLLKRYLNPRDFIENVLLKEWIRYRPGKIFFILVTLFIFTMAIFFRYSEYLDFSYKVNRPELYTFTLGSGSDADAEIRCAIELVRENLGCSSRIIDYIFFTKYMGFLMDTFGFIKSMELTAYTTIFIGSLISIIPFLLLSFTKKGFSMGGFFASIAVMINTLLIYNSSGRVVKYNASLLFFTIFFLIYFITLHRKTLKWMIGLGIVAFLDVLNKPVHFFNNFPLLTLFPFLISINFKRIKLKKYPPFIDIRKISLWKKKIFWKGFVPVAFFIGGIIYYHFYYYQLFHYKWFLWEIFSTGLLQGHGNFLGGTINSQGEIFSKVVDSIFSILQGVNLVIGFSQIPYYIFLILTILMILSISRKALFVTCLSFFLSSLITYSFLHSSLVEKTSMWVVRTYTFFDVMEIYLFLFFLFFLAIQSRVLLAVVAMQIFYLLGLSLSLFTTSQMQLFVTSTFWIILCVGFSIDHLLKNKKNSLSLVSYIKKPQLPINILIIIIIVFFLPKFFGLIIQSSMNQLKAQKEYKYLSWVNTILPKDAIILGGVNDNLLWVSPMTQRTILYNARWNAFVIKYNMRGEDYRQLNSDFIDVLRNKSASTLSETNIFFLDNGDDFWMRPSYWTKLSQLKGTYSFKEYAVNKETGRRVYGFIKIDSESGE